MIDEKKLIERIYDEYHGGISEVQLAPYQVINMIDEQPKTDWIPFNEPPKEDDTYIVAWLPIGLDCMARTKHYYALWEFENDEWEIDVPESYKNFEIIGIAWQPLPQPYKKEGAENDE